MSNSDTFARGQSPTYSDDLTSENGMSTLPIGDKRTLTDNCLSQKMRLEVDAQKRVPKGRNTFAFWTLVSLLFILTIGNLLLTVTIIGVLRLGKGMQGMELIQAEEVIKFFGITDLDRIYKRDGHIEGFVDQPVTITGDNSAVQIKLLQRNGHLHNKLTMNKNGTSFNYIDKFEVKDPVSGDLIFTTHRPHYNIPKGVDRLVAKMAGCSRVTSPIGKPLMVHSDGAVSIRGSEGIGLGGVDIKMHSDQNIYVKTTNGTIVLSGIDGVILDMDNMPVVNSEYGIRTGSIQYKICVCMPQGRLYRIPVPRIHSGKITCAHFNPKHDPCT